MRTKPELNYGVSMENGECPTVPKSVLIKRLRDKEDDPTIRQLSATQMERDSAIISDLRTSLYGAKAKVKALEERCEMLEHRVKAKFFEITSYDRRRREE